MTHAGQLPRVNVLSAAEELASKMYNNNNKKMLWVKSQLERRINPLEIVISRLT